MRLPALDSSAILALRPAVQRPSPGMLPLEFFREQECSTTCGKAADVLTVLIRGSECQFRCLMCDLWKGTHVGDMPPQAVSSQIVHAVASAGTADWLKLYNAANFFAQANVPKSDLENIARVAEGFERVIVENHPRVRNSKIVEFSGAISGQLEIAMGLETIHPEILPRLNKQMDLSDFSQACEWLTQRCIDIRTFVLLRPPGLSEAEGLEWCVKSVRYAMTHGARHVSMIATRSGNGALDYLEKIGSFEPPLASSLEDALDLCLADAQCVVNADPWGWSDLRGLCALCAESRLQRLVKTNATQTYHPHADYGCRCRSS